MKDINKIKMIISDVDGVWTDGSIYKGHSSTADIELKKFSVTDGAAVALIREAGLKLALISGRKSYLAGRMKKKEFGSPSSPKKNLI